jgi:hypothetical protein
VSEGGLDDDGPSSRELMSFFEKLMSSFADSGPIQDLKLTLL